MTTVEPVSRWGNELCADPPWRHTGDCWAVEGAATRALHELTEPRIAATVCYSRS